MKNSFRLLLAATVACILLAAGCKKGDTGAAGPAGTANVSYSPWLPTSNWVVSTTSTGVGKKTYYNDISEAKITQDILDKGTVLVYAKFVVDPDGPGSVKLLPSIYYDLGSATTQYRFQHSLMPGKIRIICDVVPNGIPSGSNVVRYVIIPGGTPVSATGRMAAPDYRSMSYEEVCRLLGIAL